MGGGGGQRSLGGGGGALKAVERTCLPTRGDQGVVFCRALGGGGDVLRLDGIWARVGRETLCRSSSGLHLDGSGCQDCVYFEPRAGEISWWFHVGGEGRGGVEDPGLLAGACCSSCGWRRGREGASRSLAWPRGRSAASLGGPGDGSLLPPPDLPQGPCSERKGRGRRARREVGFGAGSGEQGKRQVGSPQFLCTFSCPFGGPPVQGPRKLVTLSPTPASSPSAPPQLGGCL